MPLSVTCTDLSFAWPDGHAVLDGLTATFPDGLTGLIGRNGSGKSTLLRILAGRLSPTGGRYELTGRVGYLPQDLTLDTQATIAATLGVAETLAALGRVEAGRGAPDDFDLLADRWDLPERVRSVLRRLGFAEQLDLDRRLATLSGGEATLLAIAALLLDEPDVLVLDEPTNNLDRRARELVRTALAEWRRPAIVVTHDRELLEVVDQIAELRPPTHDAPATVRVFGGAYTAYAEALAVEEEANRRGLRDAERDLERQQRELAEMRVKLDRRARYARSDSARKRRPKIIMHELKRKAQVSSAKLADQHQAEVARAEEAVVTAEERVRDDAVIRIDLSDTGLPAARDVVVTEGLVLRTGRPVDLHVRGPERIGLVGPNGSGKTTLIDTLTGAVAPRSGRARVLVPHRVLPQRMSLLDDDLSVLEAVRRAAPGCDDNTVHARLARFLLAGDAIHRTVRTLSGGERFRATLAALLLGRPAPQLLIVDEPTNNLDLDSVAQLVAALRAYRGALIVASHDEPFLAEIGLTDRLDLGDVAAP